MKVTMTHGTKDYIEFLQACSRSFADTLRFIYIHDMGKYYHIQYYIDVSQKNRINEIEAERFVNPKGVSL